MKPAVAAHEPLSLIGETLSLLAWHIPDLVSYQHHADEWWFAPLDDNLPIVRLNRTCLEMLQAMNGHTAVGALVEKYGAKVCGPDGQPGQWHLAHWALPTYSLCYFGTEPPGGHRHRTHDHPLGLFGRWEHLRIRFRDRPAKWQLYTSRVGSRSLPLSLPNPSHHARNHSVSDSFVPSQL